jgi:DNA mismatch repair protein MSH2
LSSISRSLTFPSWHPQLAKRKADDLEDFNETRTSFFLFLFPAPLAYRPPSTADDPSAGIDGTNPSTNPAARLSAPEIAEGTALVESFLEAWAARAAELPPSTESQDAAGTTEEDVELKHLVACYEEYKERFEKNEWAQQVLSKTY